MYELDYLREQSIDDSALKELTEALYSLLEEGRVIQVLAYARNTIVDFSDVSRSTAKEKAVSERFHSFQIKTKSATYYVPLTTYRGFTIEKIAKGKLLKVKYANYKAHLHC